MFALLFLMLQVVLSAVAAPLIILSIAYLLDKFWFKKPNTNSPRPDKKATIIRLDEHEESIS